MVPFFQYFYLKVGCILVCNFTGTSTKAFFKGIETWKKESIIKVVAWNFTSSSALLY